MKDKIKVLMGENKKLKKQIIELKKTTEKLIDKYNFARSEVRRMKLERKADENIL